MAFKRSSIKDSAGALTIKRLRGRVDNLQNRLVKAKQERVDGWGNVFSGLGIEGTDRSVSTRFDENDTLIEMECQALYRADGIGKCVVDIPVGDMLREGYAVVGDSDGEVYDEMKRLKAYTWNNRALTWARVYGGSLMVLGIDDGGILEDELNIDNISRIEFIKVYDRHRVQIIDVYDDPEEEKFGQPKVYRVTPLVPAGVTSIPDFDVHESRTIFWDGVDVPDFIRQNNEGWGDSVYQAGEKCLADLGVSFAGAARIIDEFVIGTLQINNLRDLIAGGQEKYVRDRIRLIDASKSMIRSVLVGEDEGFKRESTTVSGLDNLLDRIMSMVSAVFGIPKVLLFGEQSQGLGSEAAGSIRLYYDGIASDQKTEFQPNLERLIQLIMLQKEGPFRGKELSDWSIEFTALWQPTEKERAETRKTQAETDQIYYNMGSIEPEEITTSRFGGDEYSYETELMFDRDEQMMKERQEENRQQRIAQVKNFENASKGAEPTDDDDDNEITN